MKVARDGPLTAGMQLREPEFSGALQKDGHQLWREVQSKLSYAVAYSPAGPAIGKPGPAPCMAPLHQPQHKGRVSAAWRSCCRSSLCRAVCVNKNSPGLPRLF